MQRKLKSFWAFLFFLSIMVMCLSAPIPLCVAQGPEEIAYDDGVFESNRGYEPSWYQAVKFSIPPDGSPVWLIAAKFYIFAGDNNFTVHVLGSDASTELVTPFETAPGHKTTEWYEVDLPFEHIVTGDFYIAVEYLHNDPFLGYDTTNPDGRSFYGKPGNWSPFSDGDLGIRAVVLCGMPAIKQEFEWVESSGTFQTVNIFLTTRVRDALADMDEVLMSGPPLDGATLKIGDVNDARAEAVVERYDNIQYHYANGSNLPYHYNPVVKINLTNGWNITIESDYIECGNTITMVSPSGKISYVYGDPHLLQANGTQQQELAAPGNYIFDLEDGYILDLECMKMHEGFSIITKLNLTGPNDYTLIYGRNNDVRISGGTPGSPVLLTAGRAVQPETMEEQIKFIWDRGLLTNLTAVSEEALSAAGKPSLMFPYGFFSFNITELEAGEAVSLNLTLPYNIPSTAEYWKCPDGEGVDLSSQLGDNDGDNLLTLTLTDGGLGDDDGEADGLIVDQGGPGWPFPIDSEPVGGVIIPVDVPSLFTPYIIIVIVIAAAALGLIAAYKKH